MGGQRGEEELVGGRVGRFNRRFEGIGGSRSGGGVDWMDIGEEVGEEPEGTQVPKASPKDTNKGK
jgi:hypothetical protein